MSQSIYGIDVWGNDDFIIENGEVKLNTHKKPSLIELMQEIRNKGVRGPVLMRFPHLVRKQIKTLYAAFNNSIKEYEYPSTFHAVFPLKVNQFPSLVHNVIKEGDSFNYGLEAGSKAELLIAISLSKLNAPISINGFKDKEMISLAFLAAKLGHDITITIEGLGELETIIDVAKKHNKKIPSIGLRVRLHSSGSGSWAKSGGIFSKFGLTATELIEALELLKKHNLIKYFKMIHFHIGSQLNDINNIKKALREVGNIYADLVKLGATHLNTINLGGGLAVEYSQHSEHLEKNYSLNEFANDVVYLLKIISESKNVKPPKIFTESGRFIAASHAVLIAPVLELFSQDYLESSLKLKNKNPPLIEELDHLYNSLNKKSAIEYLHDGIDHMESLLTLFDLGYIDLIDRSNAEILVHLIIKKTLQLQKTETLPELQKLESMLQERYLVNTSFFQSMPDYWGIKQNFPIMPLTHLDKKPLLAAYLWDITCDSDGEIEYKTNAPLHLHDINLNEEEYFLGFFLVGAYQESLRMAHNLFTHPNEITVTFNKGGYELEELKESDNLIEILNNIGYNIENITSSIKKKLENVKFISIKEKEDTLAEINLYLSQNGYLRTTY